jgi:DNA-binding NtrC family response regulator/tetratricopeptide (TPR) repeat protein
VELVADRFVVNDHRTAIDLSSGDRMELLVSAAGVAAEQRRWASRCERLLHVRHRAIAPLVDYGVIGETRRFEAWRCDRRWVGTPARAGWAIRAATLFLRANGLSTGAITPEVMREHGGDPVVVPGPDTGYETESIASLDADNVLGIEAYGLGFIAPPALTAIADLFVERAGPRPIVIGLSAREGGITTALREVARAARLSGHVPLAVPLVDERVLSMVDGRSVLLISRVDQAEGWRSLVGWTLHARKPPILLFAGKDEVPGVQTVRLVRFERQMLVAAVRPSIFSAHVRRRLNAAAVRSGGIPGRFVDLLWGSGRRPTPRHDGQVPRAAEGAAAYGPDTIAPELAEVQAKSWVAPGELASLRRRMHVAIAKLARGQHAAGDRLLRQAVGGLTRREDWLHATRGGLALGRSLVRRGRSREAECVLAEANTCALRAADHGMLIDIAVATGIAFTDELHLDAAETALHAAVTASAGFADPARVCAGSVALARCLFWLGRFDEAERLLNRPEVEASLGADAVYLAAERSRIALGRGDPSGARRFVVRAQRLASDANDPALLALGTYASAFAHLAVGDCPAAERDAFACVREARTAHHPLLAIRARLVAAECARRAGRHAAASSVVSRIGRIARSQLPPLVRARHALLLDLLTAPSPIDVLTRHVQATGLKALALCVPSDPDGGFSLRTAVNDIVDILACCQTAEDDDAVLGNVCARLRVRLQAASVGFFVHERDVAVPVASDGSRSDPAMALRVAFASQPIPPHRVEERIEGGAPVRYGGRLVGALTARWALGSSVDDAAACVLLTTAASAAGPALAALAVRRSAPPGGGSPELIGTSAGIDEVRRAIERAAPAPFAVLILGESGSGKELVARALHRGGPRRDRPFCTLNCAALPDDLVESELFGHARGAFTGAVAERPGVFEEAHTGTLFLDEIGELSLRAQAKVLRTIQEGELRRVGENIPRRIDVRVVTATNRDLGQAVADGIFRLDLLYRLDVVRIMVPPLRERRDDVPMLAEHFWREATGRVGSRAALSTATVAALARYDWPGNVRELQNVLASLAVRSPKRGVVAPTGLPPQFDGARADPSWRLEEARRTFDTRFIRAALARSGGHRARAAEELGVTRQGLTKLMVRLGIAESP